MHYIHQEIYGEIILIYRICPVKWASVLVSVLVFTRLVPPYTGTQADLADIRKGMGVVCL